MDREVTAGEAGAVEAAGQAGAGGQEISLEGGSYEVLRDRLREQGARLAEKTDALNKQRKQVPALPAGMYARSLRAFARGPDAAPGRGPVPLRRFPFRRHRRSSLRSAEGRKQFRPRFVYVARAVGDHEIVFPHDP